WRLGTWEHYPRCGRLLSRARRCPGGHRPKDFFDASYHAHQAICGGSDRRITERTSSLNRAGGGSARRCTNVATRLAGGLDHTTHGVIGHRSAIRPHLPPPRDCAFGCLVYHGQDVVTHVISPHDQAFGDVLSTRDEPRAYLFRCLQRAFDHVPDHGDRLIRHIARGTQGIGHCPAHQVDDLRFDILHPFETADDPVFTGRAGRTEAAAYTRVGSDFFSHLSPPGRNCSPSYRGL